MRLRPKLREIQHTKLNRLEAPYVLVRPALPEVLVEIAHGDQEREGIVILRGSAAIELIVGDRLHDGCIPVRLPFSIGGTDVERRIHVVNGASLEDPSRHSSAITEDFVRIRSSASISPSVKPPRWLVAQEPSMP